MTPFPEAVVRAKVVELLDGCNARRLDIWVSSGLLAGVLDPILVERVLNEEICGRAPEVQGYWLAPCNCHGRLN